jgi:MYXO-CTERM domain-containing protein
VVGVLGSDEPLCGDGVLDPLEGCDDGASNSDSAPDACRTDCTRPRCGDGVVDSAEACDDGDVISGDGCSEFCRDEGGSGGESTTSSGSSSGGETDTETAGQGSDLTDRGCVCTADAEGPGRASWVMLSALALGLRRRRRG